MHFNYKTQNCISCFDLKTEKYKIENHTRKEN